MNSIWNTFKGTKIWTLLGVQVFVPLLLGAQTSTPLQPYKVTIFQDAVQVGQKGIIRFNQERAEVPMALELDPRSVDLIASGDFEVDWFRFRNDTVVENLEVRDWNDILRANISRRVSILYQIGAEFDEVSGDIRWVDGEQGYLLLRGDNTDYFIPLDQIKQVIVEGFSAYKLERAAVRPTLEVHLTKDAPFVPLEMFSLHDGMTWEPVCRIRIVGSERAFLEMNAMVTNQLHNFKEVEVEISPGTVRSTGQMSGDIAKLGKLSLTKGDRLLVNYRKVDLKYQQLYEVRVPWMGVNTNDRLQFPVRKLMRFTVPVANAFSCNQHTILDENNRTIANIDLGEASDDGTVELDLGEARSVNVNVVEVEKKRGKKPTEVNGEKVFEVSIEGKLIVYNVSTQALTMDAFRELRGTVTGTNGGDLTLLDPASQLHQLQWTFTVDPGQKKEFRYKYDTYVSAGK